MVTDYTLKHPCLQPADWSKQQCQTWHQNSGLVVVFLTQVEEVKHAVHGVLPVQGVVLQTQDQQLVPAEDGQPI